MSSQSRFFSVDKGPEYLDASRLYERQPVTKLWNKLTLVAPKQWEWKNVPNKQDPIYRGSRRRILQVRGPPGTGKSSATYHWVSSSLFGTTHQAVWISCATSNGRCWTVKHDESTGTRTVIATEHSVPLTKDDLEFAHIVVFDGIRAQTLENWRGLMNDVARLGIFVVVVSSEGVFFHAGDSQDIAKLEHFVPSWTMLEYEETCRDDQFWSTCYEFFDGASQYDDFEVRKSKVMDKFKTAGHSARFMFKTSTAETTQEVRAKARAMGGIDSLEAAARSDRSAGAVNTLIARLQTLENGTTPEQQATFAGEADFAGVASNREDLRVLGSEVDDGESFSRILSASATEAIIQELPTNIERLRNLARTLDNQAMLGYALELQLRKKLNEAQQHGNTLVLNRGALSFPVSSVISCGPGDDCLEILAGQHADNTWIFIAGRQGAFDAVHIASNTHIRFVQVTGGKKHSFKLHILDKTMKALALREKCWTHLEFMVVRPEDDHRKFHLETTEGGLQNYLRFDEEQWHRNDYRNNVQYATIDWN